VFLLIVTVFAGCGTSKDTQLPETEVPVIETTLPSSAPTEAATEIATEAATEAAPENSEEDIVYEGDASSYYIDVAYAEQIGRYYTALVEKWDEDKYIENGMCEVLAAYYDGNPLDNVGFGFVDLDADGYWELVIGAIQDAETEPAIFEIWTMVDGEPVMLAQAGATRQYALQYVEEDNAWYVANEDAHSVFCHGTYYLMLNEGKFEVVQGILYNSEADEQNPWFLTYDLDWNASNDHPTDEETAYAILEVNRALYTALELFPYIFY
jgi:hypothetical protein